MKDDKYLSKNDETDGKSFIIETDGKSFIIAFTSVHVCLI